MSATSDLTSWAVFGERGSGTRILTRTLKQRIPSKKITNLTNGHVTKWKHGFWCEDQADNIPDDCLVVVVKKDIYAWLHSLYRSPWHMPWVRQQGISFPEFIRHEYHSIANGHLLWNWYGVEQNEELPERMPDGNRYPNPIHLWCAKYAAWEKASESHPCVTVDYEKFLVDPIRVQDEIISKGLALRGEPVEVDDYKRLDYYLDRQYLRHYRPDDLEFVEDQLFSASTSITGESSSVSSTP